MREIEIVAWRDTGERERETGCRDLINSEAVAYPQSAGRECKFRVVAIISNIPEYNIDCKT